MKIGNLKNYKMSVLIKCSNPNYVKVITKDYTVKP